MPKCQNVKKFRKVYKESFPELQMDWHLLAMTQELGTNTAVQINEEVLLFSFFFINALIYLFIGGLF